MVTVPHFDLRKVAVQLRRNGQTISLSPEQVVNSLERPDTVLVRSVKVGDEIVIGEVPPNTPVLPCRIAKKRTLSD